MAESGLFWLGCVVGAAFLALLTVAGMPLVGLVLGGVVILASRAALAPDARSDVNEALREACDRLPFCDCRSEPR